MGVEYYENKREEKKAEDLTDLELRVNHNDEHLFIVDKDIEARTTGQKMCRIKKGTLIFIERGNIEREAIENGDYHISFYYPKEDNRAELTKIYVNRKEIEGINKKLKVTPLISILQKKYNHLYAYNLDKEIKSYEINDKLTTYLSAIFVITGVILGFITGYHKGLILGVLVATGIIFTMALGVMGLQYLLTKRYMKKHNLTDEDDFCEWFNSTLVADEDNANLKGRAKLRVLKQIFTDGVNLFESIKEFHTNKKVSDIHFYMNRDYDIFVGVDNAIGDTSFIFEEEKTKEDDNTKTKTKAFSVLTPDELAQMPSKNKKAKKNKKKEIPVNKPEDTDGNWQTFPNSPLQLFVTNKSAQA